MTEVFKNIFSVCWFFLGGWSIYATVAVLRGRPGPALFFTLWGAPLIRVLVWPTLAVDFLSHNWVDVVIDVFVIGMFYRRDGGGGGGYGRKVKELATKLGSFGMAPSPA